ncbi:LuxR C-terminal-related transcriptional regulator [Sandaracinus amylolyticus]|uniref:Two component transcriptional regulator, LuxR family n=1 Tax=Sandaracinus amylolyticus TaxID=927083 RepID=A0A0F6YJ85_9BACT|nr:response regulator transcription factor [Sandaracinus amylolyticus]AKF07735.1 Two component transcriptional regulator, LuxR family [Sandaracinus amylolyticus]
MPGRATTKLLIVDDQTIFRDMLVEWLAARDGIEIVGAFSTTNEASQTLATRDVDVLLLDVGLPGESGLAFLRRLAPGRPKRVVLVTAHEEPWVLEQAVSSRAHAIVMKGAPLSDLATAIDRVVAGETFYCRRTAELLRRHAARREPAAELTSREREILALVARGATSREIADALGIREKTVQNHRANLMQKLDIHDVASLTRFALAHGLVTATGS